MNLSTYETRDLGISVDWLRILPTPRHGVVVIDSSGEVSLAAPSGQVRALGPIHVTAHREGIDGRMIGASKVLLSSAASPGSDDKSLYLIDLEDAALTELATSWSFLDTSGAAADNSYIVLPGRVSSEESVTLYAFRIEAGAARIELDGSAVGYFDISIRDGAVYYTARVSDNPGDVEVRKVDINSDGDPEVLYEGARLIATAWTEPVQGLSRPAPGRDRAEGAR